MCVSTKKGKHKALLIFEIAKPVSGIYLIATLQIACQQCKMYVIAPDA